MTRPARLGRIRDAEGRLRLAEFPDPHHAQPLLGDLFGRVLPAGDRVPLADVTLLPPVQPGKIVAVAANYRKHAREMGREITSDPRIFLKAPSTVIGPGAPIPLPHGSERVDHEVELAVVIGRAMKRVTTAEALDHVLGYTCANDVTARDFQKIDRVFGRAKSFDGFCPLGPWIATDIPDPQALGLRCRVGDALRQDGTTANMLHPVAELLAFISQIMTLHPADVVLTGTPAGVGPLYAGDVVTLEIAGVGTLTNPVVAAS